MVDFEIGNEQNTPNMHPFRAIGVTGAPKEANFRFENRQLLALKVKFAADVFFENLLFLALEFHFAAHL